jgi:ABC-type sugar transport system ATPase subunit
MVGANGSGKSTIFNLLNRLYDASSGNIFIDGQPINQYRVADLHQATATLSQEHRLFPLAVSENIGLGNISSVADLDMITESAKRGGSFSFISKLKHSLSTNLYPPRTAYIATFRDRSHPLWSIFEKLEKPVELSGLFSLLMRKSNIAEGHHRRRKTASSCASRLASFPWHSLTNQRHNY